MMQRMKSSEQLWTLQFAQVLCITLVSIRGKCNFWRIIDDTMSIYRYIVYKYKTEFLG